MIDLIVVNLAYMLTLWVTDTGAPFDSRLTMLLINGAMIIVILVLGDIHTRRVVFADRVVVESLKAVALHAVLYITGTAFAISPDLSWRIAGVFYAVFTIGLAAWWVLSRQLLKLYRTHGFNYKRVIVIGGGDVGQRLVNELRSDAGYGYRILGFFDDDTSNAGIEGYRGTLDDVEKFVQENQIDEMYCAVPDTDKKNVTRMIKCAERNAVDMYYVPQFGPTVTRRFELQTIGNVPLMAQRPYPLSSTFNRALKRTVDIVLSLIALCIVLPLWPFIAIGIKLSSPGDVFFKQLRTGYRGNEFICYKFRTMRDSADKDTKQATRDDPRKTKFGNFLRRTNLDELPQLLNVLKGDMSIVGPRPHMVKHTEMYKDLIEKYMVRHIIKPGITGWAQVNGYRGETRELWQMEKRVECDVWYAENWNLMLDFKIMFLTVWNMIHGEKNAF